MLDFEYLPVAHEGVEVGRGFKMQHSSCHLGAVAADKLATEGEDGMDSVQSLPQGAAIPGNELADSVMTDQASVKDQSGGQPSNDTGELPLNSVRTLRSASKRQEKTLKSEKQTKKNSAEEKLEKAEVGLQSYQNELKAAEEKLAASRKESRDRNAQLRGKTKDLATCRRQLRESRGHSRHLKVVNNDLLQSLKASREELSKCKDDLFSLHGVAQTPDSAIVARFESLGQQIMHWVDTEVARFEKAHPAAEPDSVFLAGEQKQSAEFLQRYPAAGEHLAICQIHRFLECHVFGKNVYFFGLPEETAELLREAEMKFAELDPPRDSVAIASWRSETLKALIKTRKCVDYCKRQSHDLNNALFKNLAKALPNLFSGQQAHATFYVQVLLPAVQLANTIKMSSSEYVITIPHLLVTTFKPVTIDQLKICKMVDIKSGKHLKPDSAVVADEDGVIGKIIMCLEPELSRVINGKRTILYQATMLVELFHPLGKRAKASA